ncbi:MAG TPA: hypothetical protein VJ890_21650 [Vineibacter sp.]|nr:hypothetical protein [Vineibacter sp.]
MVWPLKKRAVSAGNTYERALAERPFPYPAPPAEAATLTDRIKAIDSRVAAIDAALVHLQRDGYRFSELASERTELLSLKAVAANRLNSLTAPPDPKAIEISRRREAIIAAWYEEQADNIMRHVAKLEAEGDHRQARVWRAELLNLRERIAQQVN